MAERQMYVKMKSTRLTFADRGVAKLVAQLPKRAKLLAIYVDVKTAFNGSGTDLLDLGTDAVGNRYDDNLDISSTGVKAVSLDAGLPEPAVGPKHEIFATYADQNSNATAGEADILVVYADPFNQ